MDALPGLRVIRADNPSPMTLDGTRTFVVGGSRPVVIDPGPADPRHLGAIQDALGGAKPAAILLTHSHSDHAAGAGPLAAATGAPVLLAPGAVHPLPADLQIDRWLRDGEELGTDAGPVRAVATPGHSPEHLAFYWTGASAPPGGALFVGDLLMGEGETTLVAPPEGDLAAYIRSLERVRQLGASIFFPAHGPPLREPQAAVERYLAHREERVEQVLRALDRVGAADPARLVKEVYGAELHPKLRLAAEGSVQAMLRYLEARGRVRRAGPQRYAPAEPVSGPQGDDSHGSRKQGSQEHETEL